MAGSNSTAFCGSPLWDSELWNAALPDLTPCFQKVVFDAFAAAVLFALSPYRIIHLYRSKKPARPHGWLSYVKTILAVCLCITALADFFYACHYSGNGSFPVDFLMPLVRFSAMVLATFILQYERLKGGHYFGGLFTFWVLHFIFGVIVLYLKTMNATLVGFVEDPFSLATHCVHLSLVIAQLALANVPEPVDAKGSLEVNPEAMAGFVSRVTFWWFTRTITQGYKRALEVTDLSPLNPEDRAGHVSALFDAEWKKELQRTARKNEETSRAATREDAQPLFGGRKKAKTASAVQPSLSLSLLRVFWPILVVSGTFKLVQDICIFIGPWILKLLIGYTKNLNEADWKGYIYAFMMFLVAVLQSLVLHQYFLKCFVIGMRVRSVIISAVYKKALHLTSLARKTSTVGEIVNLMSVDAQRFMDLATYMHMLWSAPFQILVALGYLWQLLGPSTLAGVAAMFLMIPINMFIANKTKAMQVVQMKLKDSRIKVMNEVLNGIKVLKLYAWEPSFKDKILSLREEELKVLRSASYLNAFGSFTWSCAPFLVSVVTFTVYVLSSPDNVLDAEKAFVSVALFNIMRFPIMMLPSVVSQFVQVRVSVQRLTKFLCHEELDPDQIGHDKSADAAISISNGNFAWEDIEKPLLQGIELSIQPGELVAVVGHVGCGKSSLISALLGDMIKVSGGANVKGSVSYVPQQAWIQNATVRDNIRFGSPLDLSMLSQIIEACALTHDLTLLPAGEMTEIGEKGINLSGGQKQRVSLARAVYQNTDIYFLDDPLSAVDSHVAKHIFDKVIGPEGLLKSKTRLLVTHGISFLPKVDKIIVMVDGKISEAGTFQQLIDHAGAFAEFLKQYFLAEPEPEAAEAKLNEAERQLRDEMLAKVSGTLQEDVRALQRQISKAKSETEYEVATTSPESPKRPSRSKDKRGSTRSQTGEHSPQGAATASPRLSTEGETDGAAIASSLPGSPEHDSTTEQSDLLAARELCKSRDQISMADMGISAADEIIEGEVAPETPTPVLGASNGTSKQALDASESPAKDKAGEKLIAKEKAEVGRVKMSVFMLYARALGLVTTIVIVSVNVLQNVAGVGANIWLSRWSDDASARNNTSGRDLYLGIYGLLGFLQGLFILLGSLMLSYGSLYASRRLHAALLQNILRSPMAFFESTPTGRIMNRFSNDTATLDEQIPSTVRMWINTILSSFFTMIIISVYTPMFLLAVVPLGVLYYFIQRFYVSTSRQLKRLESVSRSPIYSHFGESVTGAPTIRAFGKETEFVTESERLVDANQICYYPNIVANRWLAVRLETIGNFIVLFAALFAVIARRDISAGIVGLSITYALNVTGTLNWLVRMTSELETNIVAVERIKEYTDTPAEAEWVLQSRPPKGWPTEGRIKFDSYAVRYREGLDLVLRGICCDINGGEKVGIVGRTGAGKSSLTLALFRILEAADGAIYLDDVKISSIGLHDLRSKLTIIPQDPVIFSGTLRSNLDPFGSYVDDDVWQALELAHLKVFVRSLPDGLLHECTEGGENLSVGQRQLLCLARALLRKTKVLILDEATAAVDLETDDLIQATIRSAFADCTVLTIAHRLNTIIDYTRIMVLDRGQIKELGPPQELLQDKGSIFYAMAKDANLVH